MAVVMHIIAMRLFSCVFSICVVVVTSEALELLVVELSLSSFSPWERSGNADRIATSLYATKPTIVSGTIIDLICRLAYGLSKTKLQDANENPQIVLIPSGTNNLVYER